MFFLTGVSAQPKEYNKTLSLMGSRFEITAVSDNETLAWQGIEAAIAEISRIEVLISSWKSASQTSDINRNAGISPVRVDAELFNLIERSKKVSGLTNGTFDISFAALDGLWKFDGTMTQLPPEDSIRARVQRVNYRDIILDGEKHTVFLKHKGMKIGFGGIGKGYAAGKARDLMQQMGIKGGLVNAGGDLICWGKREDGSDWKIGIADPKDGEKIFSWLTINDMAVVTSGDYERFAMIDGVRYAHIIDPATGYPVKGITSVTIICPNSELADALATAVFVLGKREGLQLINELNGVEGLIITDSGELISSSGLKLNYYSDEEVPLTTYSIGAK